MTSDLTCDEVSAVLDAVAGELISAAQVNTPPVNAIALAGALGLTVAADDRQTGRARLVRLGGQRRVSGSILVRPEARPERIQWAVAHEIGEAHAEQVFRLLAVDPREVADGMREEIANQLAGRLLLPAAWFHAHAMTLNWDLLALKARYTTASHALIARRMLDFTPPIMITVFDNGQLTWRQSNIAGRVPPLTQSERVCHRRAHETNRPATLETAIDRTQAWPIHEPPWQREILRHEPADEFASWQ